MTKADRLPEKKDVARALLLKGTVFVHLDPRLPGVSVPSWLNKQPQLVLQVGLDMPVPIPDLRVDEAGVSGTLSFSRMPFLCVVPWSAVFAVVGDDGRGMVWPTSMPDEIAAEVAHEARRAGHGTVDQAQLQAQEPELLSKRAKKPKRSDRASDVETRQTEGAAESGRPPLDVIEGQGASHGPTRTGRTAPNRERPSYLRVVK